jgi:hypothetical protein
LAFAIHHNGMQIVGEKLIFLPFILNTYTR